MGVPGFFAWILKNYKNKNIIRGFIEEKVNVLYLDANCLFHPQCFKTLDHFKNWKTEKLIEEKMMKRIIAFIDFLYDYVDPDELFISVDGVAPMAKMNQQRKRRYRSGDDAEIINNIKLKHGKEIGKRWSNTVITPGTTFMERLHNKILKYMKTKKDSKIIYSSYHTPGEGEHKILQDIKERSKTNSKPDSDQIYVIYGLDADLLFLSTASQKENIYLLREAQHFGKSKPVDEILQGDFFEDVFEELNYVHIDTMKECINDSIKKVLAKKLGCEDDNTEKFSGIDFNDDFIFVCYLLGNDFLPHLPSVDIKTGGLDFLIDCYTDVYKLVGTELVIRNKNGIQINDSFLDILLKDITKYEGYYFSKRLPKYKENWARRRCPFNGGYDRELWELENMISFDVYDPIRLGEDDPDLYKYRYYEHYFGTRENQKEHITNMCIEYIKGIVWVSKYYFESCPSWEWQYPYTHAPFISDLSHVFSTHNKTGIDTDTFKFVDTKPLSPCTQLLSVLPPICSDILPYTYRSLVSSSESPIIDMYPQQIELDMINKCMYYQCIPLIPCVDIRRLEKAIRKLKLTKEESIRNKILPNFTNFK